MGSKNSFSDTGLSSTAISAISAIAAKISVKKILKFSMRAIFAPRAPIWMIFKVLEFSEPRDHSRA
jgi:hypothetical protein